MSRKKQIPWYVYLYLLIPIYGIIPFVLECERRGIDPLE